MNDEQIILKIILDLKEILIKLDETTCGLINYNFDSYHVLDDKSNYPIDFQIFIEEFGFGEIGYYGCTLVNILEPEVFPYSDIWDVMMSTNCSPEDSFAGSNTLLKDACIVGFTASAGEVFGFDKNKAPYKFINTFDEGGPSFGSFLEFVSVQIKYGPLGKPTAKRYKAAHIDSVEKELWLWYKSLAPLSYTKYFNEKFEKFG